MKSFTHKEIEQYYDLSQTHYEKFWDLRKSRSLHYGYWDQSTKNFHEALLNINKILSEKARIEQHHTVLDAGCGIGGSSVWLAKQIGCSVTGISLSAKQVATANAIAAHDGVSSLVVFEQKDFTATGYADESFDIVWAIESVCHAPDKTKFIREAFRLLKPGGRLIMADFFKQPGLSGKDAELIRRWANGWAIDDFATIEDFTASLSATGFQQQEIEDVTSNIMLSARRLYRAYFPGMIGGFLYRLFHRKATVYGKKNIDTALLQYKSLKKKLWTYHIILACKTGILP